MYIIILKFRTTGGVWVEETGRVKVVFSMGIAAAAASVAAARFLFGRDCCHVLVKVQGDQDVAVPVTGCLRTERGAEAWVTRDGGDDPDVTNGVVIVSAVEVSEDSGVTVLGGKGVGVVASPGLMVPPGRTAIHPGPLALIRKSLERELPFGKGARVTISIPNGEELAKRTYNPRLGIVGGLSIFDTPLVATHLNADSITAGIKQSLSELESAGARNVCLVPGNYGRRMALILGVPESMIVNISNCVGESLAIVGNLGFENVLMIGQIGKLAKFASGSYDTHNSRSGGRMEAIAAYAALHGAESEDVRDILDSSMPDEIAARISKTDWGAAALHELTMRVVRTARSVATGIADCAALTFSLPDRELARTSNVAPLLRSIKEDALRLAGTALK